MPEKNKQIKEKKAGQKPKPEKIASDDELLSKDKKEKSYYYDDSHGYEVYDPEKHDDDE